MWKHQRFQERNRRNPEDEDSPLHGIVRQASRPHRINGNSDPNVATPGK